MKRKKRKGRRRPYNRLGGQDLYARMVRLMTGRKLYLDKDCNRDRLARELMTNRTYVSRALNARGMSCAQFVNSFRAQHAIGLLASEDQAELPLADIAELSGFSTIESMNRYVKKCVGLTACALRKKYTGARK